MWGRIESTKGRRRKFLNLLELEEVGTETTGTDSSKTIELVTRTGSATALTEK